MSLSRRQPWGDLVAARVTEACPGLGTGLVCSAVSAAAPSAKALSVLAWALGPGPGALAVGAPPVVGKLVSELRARQEGPVAADDERWATARSLLHDEDIDLADRVAGLLVLLYGQQLSRITTLTRDQVELTSGGARLHLGASAFEVPPPLGKLLARLVAFPWCRLAYCHTLAVPWPRPRATPHCWPARPTAAPSRHRTGRRTAFRTRPSGRRSSRARAGPSARPLTGHCCPLGWNGGRRLGRIGSGVRSLGQHRQLRPPRLPPKPESSVAERQKVKPFTTYFHARQKGEGTSADRGRLVPRQEGLSDPTAYCPQSDHEPCRIARRAVVGARYSAQFEHRLLPVSTPGCLSGTCKRRPLMPTPGPPCAMTGPGCRLTVTPLTWWPPSSPGQHAEARQVMALPRRMGSVATLEQPGEPEVRAYPPEDALRRSRPLPRREDLVVTDVPDDEWAAFQEALAET